MRVRSLAAGPVRAWHDHIPGGRADACAPADFDWQRLQQGTDVEMEHTDNIALATEIAMDHLVEDPQYYEKLATIDPRHGLGGWGAAPTATKVMVALGLVVVVGAAWGLLERR